MTPRTIIAIDQNWQFKQADKPNDSFRAVSQFPTNIHLDLLRHKLIPDPFMGKNEADVQWVGETRWTYKTTFASPSTSPSPDGLVHCPKRKTAVLVFDGLDTFATVVLNGETILESSNMFTPQRVDVGAHLALGGGENELAITFDSAFLTGWKRVDMNMDHAWICWNGDNSRLAVRKAQYHWGWDWGPALITCGPWRPINLEMYESRIADVYTASSIDESLKRALVTVQTTTQGQDATHIRLDISLAGQELSSETISAAETVSIAFHVDKPMLWYPVRYGEQPLYTVRATLLKHDRELDSMTKRIGLRRARLVEHQFDDQPGKSFYFEINNIPIFCGGSNWIPADSFLPRISSQRYRDWVKLVADGNQCMIRVWGGGIYEEEAFYDACDEMGILVWQDFMFACGNYPVDAQFVESIKCEAEANVKRLRHHPCIVLWAGNNEDYQLAESEKLEYDAQDLIPENWLKSNFPARYIYETVLAGICKRLIPSVPYRYGSPWGGRDSTDASVGDIHQWNVWHGSQEKYQDFDKLVGRFVSEFGMEAFPSANTIDAYLLQGKDDADRYAQSCTVDFHNKAAGHERRLALYLAENIRYSPNSLEDYVYCTQLIQAECLGSAYRLWRREWRGRGREYCGGALVWQMNDCWPVTSWSICDYYLRPKYAYYTVKREMSAITVGLTRHETQSPKYKHTRAYFSTKTKFEIWGSSLMMEDIQVDCLVKAWDVETGEEQYSQMVASGLKLEANRSTEIVELPFECQRRGEMEKRTVVAAYLLRDGEQVARCVNWPEPLKYLHLQKPERLTAEISRDGSYVAVSAEVPVKGVALESEDGGVRFEDNLVDIVPGETVKIRVDGTCKGTVIRTRHLNMLSWK